ncbi:MAG: hypothetical protein ISS18_02985 [Bacteroidales bacterium]|nr:hypothetical protein [Bacteroidales bacterium]
MKKLEANQIKSQLRNEKIDILISSSSFEDRCFVIPEIFADFNIQRRIIFSNYNEGDLVRMNASKLVGINKEKSKLVEFNSNDPISIYNQISNTINEIIIDYSKPRVVIDITTFTHESLLILLKYLDLTKSSFNKITCFYVGAKEYSFNIKNDDEKWLSKGILDIRTIIGYPGLTDFTEQNHLMILFGFEFNRTRQIIKEYEYDIISIGFADIESSIQTNHQKINYERHSKIVSEYSNINEFIFSCVNPYNTKKQILDYINQTQFKDLNTVIAPLNNKLSTIGAGLAALENEKIQLAYAKPAIYNTFGYSIPNKDIYFFDLTF